MVVLAENDREEAVPKNDIFISYTSRLVKYSFAIVFLVNNCHSDILQHKGMPTPSQRVSYSTLCPSSKRFITNYVIILGVI